MKKYRVTIDLDAFEIVVSANNKAEAKRKAIERLQRKKITSLIRKSWPDNKKEVYVDVPYPPEQCNGYIHCGTNEALFLAIAALRDDTDDSQWFVYPPENIWFICDDDDINYARENIKDSVQAAWFHCSHKATVKELIEHFKSV